MLFLIFLENYLNDENSHFENIIKENIINFEIMLFCIRKQKNLQEKILKLILKTIVN